MLIKNELHSPSEAGTVTAAALQTDHSNDRFQPTPSSSSASSSQSSSPTPQSLAGSPTTRNSPNNNSGNNNNSNSNNKSPNSNGNSVHQLLRSVSQQFRQSVEKDNTQEQHEANNSLTTNGSFSGSPTSDSKVASFLAASPTESYRLDVDNSLESSSSNVFTGEEPTDCVTIIHFNDCYNIEPGPKSSGAAGFLTAVNQYRHLNPMILFSGDILSPSFMSTFTKGEQMIPVLNDIGVHCAVFGNHEFDYGVDNLIDFTKRTTFPWLLSNVIDKETSNQLGDGLVYHIIERAGFRFGLIGLIEEEWLSTLSTLDSSDVIYTDYVERGRELARWLKGPAHKVDYVIALTHFRTPNDIRLADSVPEIDLILGGHDHDYEIIERSNCHIIKSGTDFREFSLIKLWVNGEYKTGKKFERDTANNCRETTNQEQTIVQTASDSNKTMKPFIDMNIERIECVSYAPEQNLKCKLDKFVSTIDEKMGKVLGQFNCELDGRFSSIRKYETNLGNFVTDIMLASTHADLAILNSGTLRSDRIHPKGDFTMRDLFNILGYIDPIAVLRASGYHIWKALENGVSQWPKLEGRFPQISGCTFAFDPRLPPLERINPKDITIGDEPLVLDRDYKLTTKAYLASGKDGYDVLKDCETLVPGDESPDLTTSILNHFEAISIIKSNRRTHHRQSIICLSRSSIKKILDQTTGTMDEFNDDNNNTDCAITECDENYDGEKSEINQAVAVATRLHDKSNDNDNNNENVNENGDEDEDNKDGSGIVNISENGHANHHHKSSKCHNNLDDSETGPTASTPLLGSTAPRPSLGNMRSNCKQQMTNPLERSASCLSTASPSTIQKQPRQPRTKRVMSLYEMEHEQCKLEPKVEGRIKILGVNH